VTLAGKGAKSRTRITGLRSNRTKASTDVDRLRASNADLERKLAEALEQQAATAEVLRVISSSPGDLQLVFETILAHATRICEAKFASLALSEGDQFRRVAVHNVPPALAEHWRRHPMVRPHPGSAFGRAALTKQAAHVDDIRTTPAYVERDPFVVAAVCPPQKQQWGCRLRNSPMFVMALEPTRLAATESPAVGPLMMGRQARGAARLQLPFVGAAATLAAIPPPTTCHRANCGHNDAAPSGPFQGPIAAPYAARRSATVRSGARAVRFYARAACFSRRWKPSAAAFPIPATPRHGV
jgi:hypothetical protein